MKACCFSKQPDSDVSGNNESDDAQSESPTSHLDEANHLAKEVVAQLTDCTLKVEGKELKAHSQVYIIII